jgi:CHAT domain-containing protein/tetratricopeptide (TPR) repeat protein
MERSRSITAWILASCLVATARGADEPLTNAVGRTVRVEAAATPIRLRWVAPSAGSFVVSAISESARPQLRVNAPSGTVFEDRGGDERTSACVVAATEANVEWTIEVESTVDGAAAIDVRCDAWPVTEAQRAAVVAAESALARARELQANGDTIAARELVTTTIATLLASDGAGEDLSVGRLLSALGSMSGAFGDSRSSRDAWAFVVRQLEASLPAGQSRILAASVNLANAHYFCGEYAQARSLFEAVLAVREPALGQNHPRVLSVRANLANVLHAAGELDAAKQLLEATISALSAAVEANDRRLLVARSNLASVLKEQGDFTAAYAEYSDVLEGYESSATPDPGELSGARMNLALVEADLGRLDASCRRLESVLAERIDILGDEHPDVARVRLNLASKLGTLGEVDRARELAERALATLDTHLDPGHSDLAWARTTLAVMVRTQGDLVGAQALFEQAQDILARNFADDHPDLVFTRAQLAVTRLMRGDAAGAQSVLERVHDTLASTYPDDHWVLQAVRVNLATACGRNGDFERERALLSSVAKARERTLPEGHPDRLLGQFYAASRPASGVDAAARFGTMASLLRQLEAVLPIDHRDVRVARDKTLCDALRAGETAAVATLVEELRAVDRRLFARVLRERGDREASVFAAQLHLSAQRLASIAAGVGTIDPVAGLDGAAFEALDAMRSIPLRAAALARSTVQDEDSTAAVRETAAEVARLATQPERRTAYFDAVRRLDALRAAHASALGGDTNAARWLEITSAAALGQSLPEHSKGIGYATWTRLSFDPSAPERAQWIDVVSAFVLDREGSVTRIDLGSRDAIVTAVEAWRAAVALEDPELELDTGLALRELVVDPILGRLGAATTLVVVLDDPLHAVALDALPWQDSVLGDAFHVVTRTCFAEAALRVPVEVSGTLVAMGDIDFGEPAAVEPVERGAANFARLPGTRDEVRAIEDLFESAFSDRPGPIVLVGDEATRDALFERAAHARFLHVATHGYFAPTQAIGGIDLALEAPLATFAAFEIDVDQTAPAVRSGLALAGANRPPNAIGRVVGRVTAHELATLDLTRCELAALSACDTSAGLQRVGQGAASLQAALHAAGARTVLTSLWEVPDDATAQLMTEFYRRLWQDGTSKAEALWAAKRVLRDARGADGAPLHSTRAWAGFVLTGEP